MKRLALLALFSLGCGSSSQAPVSPEKPVPPAAVVAAESTPQCASKQACDDQCAGGDVRACTLSADFQFDGNTDAALAAYRLSCDKNEPLACWRLAQLSGDRLPLADGYLGRACAAGSVDACTLRAQAAVMAAMAPSSSEDRDQLLQAAEQASKRACELGSYSACLDAADLLKNRSASGAEVKPVGDRGFELAVQSCEKGDAKACETAVAWAIAARDKPVAASAATQWCRIVRTAEELRTEGKRKFEELRECTRAGELRGDDPAKVRADTEPTPGERGKRVVAQRVLEAQRLVGKTQIPPAADEAMRITQSRKSATVVVKFCVSERGTVSNIEFLKLSAHPRWHRAIFEAIRGWRYSPVRVNGKALRVCSTTTFVYAGRR